MYTHSKQQQHTATAVSCAILLDMPCLMLGNLLLETGIVGAGGTYTGVLMWGVSCSWKMVCQHSAQLGQSHPTAKLPCRLLPLFVLCSVNCLPAESGTRPRAPAVPCCGVRSATLAGPLGSQPGQASNSKARVLTFA